MKVITNSVRNLIRKSHNRVSHQHRVKTLSKLIIDTSRFLLSNENSWLDIGCGDMQISKLILKGKPELKFKFVDVYTPTKEQAESGDWSDYQQYSGNTLPFAEREFDVAMLVDVLHHCDNIPETLSEARRVSDYVIIKDHYEYGFYSRTMLRLMDVYGNWPNGVRVPKRYFTQTSFRKLCEASGFEIVSEKIGINLYKSLPFLSLWVNSKWQFVAVLRRIENRGCQEVAKSTSAK